MSSSWKFNGKIKYYNYENEKQQEISFPSLISIKINISSRRNDDYKRVSHRDPHERGGVSNRTTLYDTGKKTAFDDSKSWACRP